MYDNQRDVYITRYTNVVGSQTQFTKPTDYPVSVISGVVLEPERMTIDTTFLMWDGGQVHQWYRAGQ
ncbi:MAG: hypothetical protein H6766_01040 [Candidatus Peribacteria bacterium]|nr:MAG: hypothetical protein H6766_01040 [Candidatus Peribacteria bacterium]